MKRTDQQKLIASYYIQNWNERLLQKISLDKKSTKLSKISTGITADLKKINYN